MKPVFQWLPESASNFATSVDWVFWTLTAISLFFILLICTLIFYFSVIYWHGRTKDRSGKLSSNLRLEIAWTIIPLIIVTFIFIWSSIVFMEMGNPPEDATEIFVVGKQWMWKIQHMDGRREINSLHIPVNQPVKLVMISKDVIHSFYVPAFRLKQDVLPGRYTTMWFEPTKEGKFHLFCAEYCGTQHSSMRGKVTVMSEKEYQEWASEESTMPRSLAGEGARVYQEQGCAECHDRSTSIKAPSLFGIYGSVVPLLNGGSVNVDENYIRESLFYPSRKIHSGFSAIMPSYKNQLSEEKVIGLIAYLKALGNYDFNQENQ